MQDSPEMRGRNGTNTPAGVQADVARRAGRRGPFRQQLGGGDEDLRQLEVIRDAPAFVVRGLETQQDRLADVVEGFATVPTLGDAPGKDRTRSHHETILTCG